MYEVQKQGNVIYSDGKQKRMTMEDGSREFLENWQVLDLHWGGDYTDILVYQVITIFAIHWMQILSQSISWRKISIIDRTFILKWQKQCLQWLERKCDGRILGKKICPIRKEERSSRFFQDSLGNLFCRKK